MNGPPAVSTTAGSATRQSRTGRRETAWCCPPPALREQVDWERAEARDNVYALAFLVLVERLRIAPPAQDAGPSQPADSDAGTPAHPDAHAGAGRG